MNEQLTQLATQGFDKAMTYLQATEDFVVEQAPLLVQEILHYGLAHNSVLMVLCFIFLAVAGYLCYKCFKRAAECSEVYEAEAPAMIGSVIAIIGLGATAGFIVNLMCVLKIVFAPRLYLIEELRRLL
jgi:uncharacterized membrane protein YoaK (UPF0700 family)